VAVKLVDWPAQMLLLPVMLQTGAGLTVSVRLQLETQPAAFVTITV
jgi:hypothetical protein